MAPTKTTKILIVGGGWHTPQSYNKLTRELKALGYDVHIPTLPSMNGSRPPNSDLSSDTRQIRSVAEGLVGNGREVIVLMHSYGGQVGTNALHGLSKNNRSEEGKAGGVTHLLYMAAYAVPEGKAMIDGVKHFGHEHLMPLAFDFAEDNTCVSRNPKTLLVGETELPASEVDEYLASLVRWNGHTMYQPLSTARAAWRDIPVTYIHTTKDMTMPFDYQKWFVEEVRKEGVELQTATLDTGHCANFTAAKLIADIVEQVDAGELRGASEAEDNATSNEDVRDAIMDVGEPK